MYGAPVVSWMDVVRNAEMEEDVFGTPDDLEPMPCECRACQYVRGLPATLQANASKFHQCEE
jgi:hypothetical protein